VSVATLDHFREFPCPLFQPESFRVEVQRDKLLVQGEGVQHNFNRKCALPVQCQGSHWSKIGHQFRDEGISGTTL
jgi:hypothetical protein